MLPDFAPLGLADIGLGWLADSLLWSGAALATCAVVLAISTRKMAAWKTSK